MNPNEYYRLKSVELRARRKVIEQAQLPARLELENKAPQMGLF